MFGSNVIEVFLGLVLIYFVLSLIVSAISELVASIFALRAQHLEDGIRVLLGDSDHLRNDWLKLWDLGGRLVTWLSAQTTEVTGKTEVEDFYKHPLIKALANSKIQPRPAYIPSRTFATVLFDNLVPAPDDLEDQINSIPDDLEGLRTQFNRLRKEVEDGLASGHDFDATQTEIDKLEPEQRTTYMTLLKRLQDRQSRIDKERAEIEKVIISIRDKNAKDTLVASIVTPRLEYPVRIAEIKDALNKKEIREKLTPEEIVALNNFVNGSYQRQITRFQELRDNLALIQNDDLRKSLSVILDNANENIETALANTEKWFDNTMDRVTGWYKQQMAVITFAIALAVVVFINADSLLIFRVLSNNATARAAIVALAESTAQDVKEQLKQQQTENQQPDQNTPPDETPTEEPAADNSGQAQGAAPEASPTPDFSKITTDEIRAQLDELQLIGWPQPDQNGIYDQADPRYFPANGEGWQRILGWLITAFAVTFGAPFWFDMLNRLVNLRTSGKRIPTQSEEEAAAREQEVKK